MASSRKIYGLSVCYPAHGDVKQFAIFKMAIFEIVDE